MKAIEMIIPSWAICPLINADLSACSDEDIVLLDEFEKNFPDIRIPCPDGEPEFHYRNDIDGTIGSDVYFLECLV